MLWVAWGDSWNNTSSESVAITGRRQLSDPERYQFRLSAGVCGCIRLCRRPYIAAGFKTRDRGSHNAAVQAIIERAMAIVKSIDDSDV
jgi:hypothetical protein